MNPTASRFATLMGSASFLTLTTALTAQAQEIAQAQTAQAQTAQAATAATVPEQVLVTGSLIHGAAAIGVPVTNLGAQDFVQTGALQAGDLFRNIPAAVVSPGAQATINGGQQERQTRVNLRGLDTTGPRSLLMVDGMRFPPQADGFCVIDPSIIPALALDRIDVLADGASATYGSDAIAGVINVILKRNFDGATTLLHVQAPDAGGLQFQASQLYGRTWDGGDVTLTYEWVNEDPIKGTAHSKYTLDYRPWGLDNRSPIGSSIPGTISSGKADHSVGTVCGNCFAIPAGTGQDYTQAAKPAFDWSILKPGTTNVVDPLKLGEESGAQQKNSIVGTFDQRLTSWASVFFTGFYTDRRVEFIDAPFYSNGATNAIASYTVPSSNPYFPTNVPANVQNKLTINFDLGTQVPTTNHAQEVADRYAFGFNLDLPFSWTGQIYESRSYEASQYFLQLINKNYVNLALGNTLKQTFSGATFTKPDSVPYLNVFCDPTAHLCNSPATLNYITGFRHLGGFYTLEEKGGRFDGPLFDLPAGQVKAAVGGTYETDNVVGVQFNEGTADAIPGSLRPTAPPLEDSEPYTVWAGFVQIDVPIFGDNFNFPLFRRLDLEGSWRHDQYHQPNGSLNGGTSNPKVGITWMLDELTGTTVRGSWGTSFRFANLGESSTILSDQWTAVGVVPGASNTINILCGANTAGSAAAALVAAGVASCGGVAPNGVEWGGGPHSVLRSFTTPGGQIMSREGGTALAPEKATNYSAGIEFAPTISFLRGLDVQATYYSIKINGVINPFNQIFDADLANPTTRFTFILPSDLGCPAADNANPAACAPFQKMVVGTLSDFSSQVSPSQATNIFWIRDGATTNSGFYHVEGVDFNASYDFDAGDYGAWNVGVTGTYFLHDFVQTVAGAPVQDLLHDTTDFPAIGNVQQVGVETMPRMQYRARLGWSNGPYNVTGFMNYVSHYYDFSTPLPPNVNCGAGCAINNFSDLLPSMYTFDLSLGYNTGDMPADYYLKNLTIQLTFQNILDKHPAFAYGPSNSHRNAAGYDILKPDLGRIIGLTLEKNW